MDTNQRRSEDESATAQAATQTIESPGAPASRSRHVGAAARIVAPVVAALLVGGGVAFAVDHHSGASTSTGNAAATAASGLPGSGGPSGAGGPVAGEQHIQGTVTAKTSTTVTVRSSSGTATYTVNATTEIVRNGQAASLAAIQAGDPVLVHVYPSSSGKVLVERLLAGSSASDGGPGGFGQPPSSGGSGPQASSSNA